MLNKGKGDEKKSASKTYLDSLNEKAKDRKAHLDSCESKIASYWKDKVEPLKDGDHIPDMSPEERKAIYDIVDNDVPNEGDYDERDIDDAIDNSLEDGNASHKELIEDIVSRVEELNTKRYRKRNGYKS